MAGDGRFGRNRFRKAVPFLPVIVLGPQDEPWGERHTAIVDLYGHEIHFSSKK